MQLGKESPRIQEESQVFHSGIEKHKYSFSLFYTCSTTCCEPDIQQ